MHNVLTPYCHKDSEEHGSSVVKKMSHLGKCTHTHTERERERERKRVSERGGRER